MAESMHTGDAPSAILPKEVSQEIWADVQEESVVMRHANRITLPGAGLVIPMVTADPTAEWVGETDEISVGDSTLSSKSMQGHKVGVIETFSKEFRRDLPAMYAELRKRLPKTIAAKFDATVLHATTGPNANFDVLGTGVADMALSSATAYDDLVAIDTAVSEKNGNVTAYVLAPKARGVLLGAVDGNDRPLLLNDIQREGGVSHLLGTPVSVSRHVYKAGEAGDPDVIGFAGDFSQAFYGVVEDITVEVSDQATVTKGGSAINLWQRDMFAVKVTAHLGFIVRTKDAFVRITGDASSSA